MEHHQMVELPGAVVVQVQLVLVRMVALVLTVFQHGHRQHQQVIQVITQAVVVQVVMETTERHL
jgi:hypothetical protein